MRCIVRKTKGIIIKSVDYGESDKIITILNEHGAKIPIMVRRLRNLKPACKLIHNSLCMAYYYNKWKGMGTLSSIDVINQYYQLRLDIFDSSYATLCVEAIDRSLEQMKFLYIIISY